MKRVSYWTAWVCLAAGLVWAASGGVGPVLAAEAAKPAEVQKAKEEKAKEKPSETKDAQKPVGEKKKDKETPPKPDGPTATVKKEPFKIEVCLSGSFEALEMTPVVLRPQAWSSLVVLTAAPHGTRVRQGDLLVALELEEIDEAIADLRGECQLADLGIRKSEEEIHALEALEPLDLAAARRGKREADEDLAYFLEQGLALSKKTMAFSLDQARRNLDYKREELSQLEKMYQADDLTEETEEIVLKRGRDEVKQAEFRLEYVQAYHDRALATELPREEVKVKETAGRQTLKSREAEVVIPLALAKRRLELEKAKNERARNEEKLNKLLADRAAMTVRAPADGIVYYGDCQYGRFTGMASAASQLQRGGRLSAENVFMTIVKPRPMRIAATLPERDLHAVRVGLKANVKPTGYPDRKVPAVVSEVLPVPTGEGSFQARLTPSLAEQDEPLMPGMTCRVTLVIHQKKDALTLPLGAVKREPLDEDARFVYRVDKDGKAKKQPVRVGKDNGEKVEILEGLAAGDKVLLEAPKDKEEE